MAALLPTAVVEAMVEAWEVAMVVEEEVMATPPEDSPPGGKPSSTAGSQTLAEASSRSKGHLGKDNGFKKERLAFQFFPFSFLFQKFENLL